MRVSRRAAVLLLLAAGAARADEAAAAPVRAMLTGLAAGMKAGQATPFATRVAALRPAVWGCFDLAAILQAAVGPRWAGLSTAQKSDLAAAFEAFTVATWVANFNADDGTRLELLAEQRVVGEDVVVGTRVVPPSGDPTRLDYVMRKTPEGWRAVDMLVDGSISRVAVQRSDFRALLKEGSATPLIAMLQDKAAELARQ
ncbi:MAG: ABC transporter substrate-binding protein [Alphaproteobacteria bacterium]|nr:ABC transporter substrate-binding protein [Alphaproteobacteria bacterium]